MYAVDGDPAWTTSEGGSTKPPTYGPSSSHPAVVIAGMGDGSTQALNKRMDAANLFFLITRTTRIPSTFRNPRLRSDWPDGIHSVVCVKMAAVSLNRGGSFFSCAALALVTRTWRGASYAHFTGWGIHFCVLSGIARPFPLKPRPAAGAVVAPIAMPRFPFPGGTSIDHGNDSAFLLRGDLLSIRNCSKKRRESEMRAVRRNLCAVRSFHFTFLRASGEIGRRARLRTW